MSSGADRARPRAVSDVGPGVELGPYRLVRRIGTGGMGEVWAAESAAGAEVAVKILPEGSLADATARARFVREVAAAQRVRHPRVQAVLGADAGAERPWLATELVPGPTLAQRVGADGAVAGTELHDLARGLAEALAAVHAAGVVHRDVSPANVVLGPDGPVLVDFGIARFADVTTLTMTGTVVGTAGWLAPELLREDEASDAADVWSWAAVLAFAATGRPPAAGSRAEVVMRKVLDGDLDLRGLPPWLDRLVRRGLDPVPARRPTAEELVATLDPRGGPIDLATAVLEPTAPTRLPPTGVAPAPPSREGRRSWAWPPLVLRAAVLGAGLLVGLLLPPLIAVLAVTVTVLAAVGLRVWAEGRATERRPLVGAGTLVAAAALATVAGLAEVIGLLFAVLALVALVIAFLALGGDFS